MTQVQTMTNQELNRKLAELMGFHVIEDEFMDVTHYKLLDGKENQISYFKISESRAWEFIPDYCTDPAASLEVQAAALRMNAKKYLNHLENSIRPELEGCPDSQHWYADEVAELFLATPREMAEAAYITLQGAKHNE